MTTNPLSTEPLAIAERWAAASSDRAKLLVLADAVAHLNVPSMSDKAVEATVIDRKHAFASWLAEEAVKL